MKRTLHIILILGSLIVSSLLLNAQVHDLPIEVDFEQFNGVNLSENYSGWTEGKGYPNPSLGSGSWYEGKVLYPTTTATVAVNNGSHKEWIISPEFNVTENTCVFFKAAISYDYNYPTFSELSSDDEFSVFISEDGGSTFTKIQEFSDELTYDLKQYHIKLDNYNEKTIRIGFFVSDGQLDNSYAVVHLDDVKIKNLKDIDLAVNNFYISDNIEQGKEISLNVEVTNEGLHQLTQIPLRIDVRGPENLTEMFVVEDALAFANNKVIKLTDIRLSAEGEYNITIANSLIGDEDENNNTYTETIDLVSNKSLPLSSLDFKYSYEDIAFYDGWKEAIGDTNVISYIESAWTSKKYKEQSAFHVPYYGLSCMDWIISPSFTVEENTYLYFKSAVELLEGSTTIGSDDKLIIYITDDGGLNWENIGEINKDNFSENWDKDYFFDLSSYVGSIVKVGLFATTGYNKDSEEYNLFIDDVSIKTFGDNDISIDEVVQPHTKAVFGADEVIAVKLTNQGKNDINNFNVSYILNNGTEVKEEVNQNIRTQESFVYYFNSKADLTGMENKITVKVELENDSDISNNEIANVQLTTFSFDPVIEGKYSQGFEDSDDYSTWKVIDGNNDGSTWELFHDGGNYDFDGYYNFRYNSQNTTVQSNEWLISNGFYLQAGTEYNVSFYFANRAGALPEKLKLTMGQEQTIAGQNIELIDFGQITNNEFLKAEKTFTVSSDGYYYFGWNDYGDADQYAVMVDKIVVQQSYKNDLSMNRLYFPKEIDYTNNILDSIRTAYIEVENQGTVSVSNIPVTLELSNSDKQISLDFNFSQTLNIGESIKLVLEDDNLAFDIKKLIDAKVYINNVSEDYSNNDTLSLENYNHFNYYTGFEYADETESWISIDEDEGGHTWKRIENKQYSNTGDYYYGVYTNKMSGYTENIDWLLTGGIYLDESECYKLKFSYKNLYSKENLKVFLGRSYYPEDLTEKVFDVEVDDFDLKVYKEAEILINVDESGIYYLGFLSDKEIDYRYYMLIDDFSLEKIETPTPEFEISVDQIYNKAIFDIKDANSNVKFWEWTIEGETFTNVRNVEHTFSNGSYTIELKAGSQCVSTTKQQNLTVDFSVANDFNYTTNDKMITFELDETNISWVSWDFGDGNYSNEISPINTYSDYGSYDVKLTIYSVIESLNINKTIKVEKEITGIGDISSKNLNVYPNPANSYIRVNSENATDLKIYNIRGQLVQQVFVNTGHNIIDVSNLKTGFYTVSCNNQNIKLIIE